MAPTIPDCNADCTLCTKNKWCVNKLNHKNCQWYGRAGCKFKKNCKVQLEVACVGEKCEWVEGKCQKKKPVKGCGKITMETECLAPDCEWVDGSCEKAKKTRKPSKEKTKRPTREKTKPPRGKP